MTGTELITAERRRQIDVEGWTPEHDDKHRWGALPRAAVAYVLFNSPVHASKCLGFWPWERAWWKPSNTDAVRNLVKAGALIAAEIDRLQRLTTPPTEDHHERTD